MKMASYYLILASLFLLTSCQEPYSETMNQQQLLWNESIQRTNLLLNRNTLNKIEKAKNEIKIKTQYAALLPKFKYITVQSDSLYNKIDHLKQILIDRSEGLSSTIESIPIKAISTSIKSNYNNYLHLMESSWDSGGIKGTIFADSRKKENRMQEIKVTLDLPFLSKIRANPTYLKRQLKDKSLAAALTLLSAIQNDIRKQAYFIFYFFDREIHRMHDYRRINLCSISKKNSIRLGETYQTEIFLGTYSTEKLYSVMLNGDRLSLVDKKGIYTIQPTQVGEQTYRPTATFLNPYTKRVDSIQKTFYFNVID